MSNGSMPPPASPIVLHPPDDAVTAELLHDRGFAVWMVLYRPSGVTDDIDDDALASELGGNIETGTVVGYIEERLRATGRTILSAHVETDSRHTTVAIWTLGRSEN